MGGVFRRMGECDGLCTAWSGFLRLIYTRSFVGSTIFNICLYCTNGFRCMTLRSSRKQWNIGMLRSYLEYTLYSMLYAVFYMIGPWSRSSPGLDLAGNGPAWMPRSSCSSGRSQQ